MKNLFPAAVLKPSLSVLFSVLSLAVWGQSGDSAGCTHPLHFSGTVEITNNGISPVPTFTLGKPAALGNVSLRRGRLSFNPRVAFALNGQPWYIIYWLRYKVLNGEKFKLDASAAAGTSFRFAKVVENGVAKNVRTPMRVANTEIVPTYVLSKKSALSVVYLYGHGFIKNAPLNLHFVSLIGSFSHIGLGKGLQLKLLPQVYYLSQGKTDGWFTAATVSLSHQKLPLALSAMANQTIRTSISPSPGFVWNTSLAFNF